MFEAVKICIQATWMLCFRSSNNFNLQRWLVLEIMRYYLLRIWPISVLLVLITHDAILTVNGSYLFDHQPKLNICLLFLFIYFFFLLMSHLTYKHTARNCIACWRRQLKYFESISARNIKTYINLWKLALRVHFKHWCLSEGLNSELFDHKSDARPQLHDDIPYRMSFHAAQLNLCVLSHGEIQHACHDATKCIFALSQYIV